MKWKKLNEYCLQSECGKYRISKTHNCQIYSAWIKEKGWDCIGCYKAANEARKVIYERLQQATM